MHYNAANSYLFVNDKEIIKFKAKHSEIAPSPLCLGNISKHWSVDNMKKTGFTGYVYDFSVDYNAIAVDDIKDIHRYLMKKKKKYDMINMYACLKSNVVFIKKIFYIGSLFLSSLVSTTPLSCITIKNQECKVRPEIINVNSNNPIFYLFSIRVNKCSGNCNNINNPYAKICVPDVIKDLNVQVFNLMSRTNETRFIKWHETCKCVCRLDGIICNSKQRWNENKCRCECKELIDKGVCDKGFIWNPSNCECECDQNCDIGEYLDYENCKCRKKLADKLIDECAETIDETKLVNITFTEN